MPACSLRPSHSPDCELMQYNPWCGLPATKPSSNPITPQSSPKCVSFSHPLLSIALLRPSPPLPTLRLLTPLAISLLPVNKISNNAPQRLVPPTNKQHILRRHRRAPRMSRKGLQIRSHGLDLRPYHLGQTALELWCCGDLETRALAVAESADGEPEGGFEFLLVTVLVGGGEVIWGIRRREGRRTSWSSVLSG